MVHGFALKKSTLNGAGRAIKCARLPRERQLNAVRFLMLGFGPS